MKIHSLIIVPERKGALQKTFIKRPLTHSSIGAIWDRCYDERAKTFTIPEGYTHMSADCSLFFRSKIESVIIPASIREIDKKVFAQCNNLKEVRVSKDNQYYIVIAGSLRRKDNCVEVWKAPKVTEERVVQEIFNENVKLNKEIQKLKSMLLQYESLLKDNNIEFQENELFLNLSTLSVDEEVGIYSTDEISDKVILYDNIESVIEFKNMFFYIGRLELHFSQGDIVESEIVEIFYRKTIENGKQIIYLKKPKSIKYSKDVRISVSVAERIECSGNDNQELIIEVVDENNRKLDNSKTVYIEFSIKDETYAVYTQ